MRKLLLTTAFALPLSFGGAFAQDAAPAADPAMDPAMTETTPMPADPMADPAAGMPEADGNAAEAAAAASAAEKVEVQQAANEWRIDWITGATVMSPDGTDIGSISDLIIDGETGEMKAVIVGVGGFLGIGQKQIALPWDDLTVNSDAQEISSDLTREEADAAPEYVFRDQAAEPGDMMADPATDPMAADPMATEPAADPMATGGMEVIGAAPGADPAAEPMDKPMADPAAEPMDEPMTDPAAEPMDEPMTDPAAEPMDEPMTDPAAEPMDEPMMETEPMDDAATETPAPAN